MDHVRLGNTGLQVSKLCLGTMTFGLQCDETTSAAIMDRAAEGGITFFDTADVYPLGGGLPTVGRTEEIVGDWLRGKRDSFVLATKCVGPTGPAPWERGSSRKHILSAVEASLRRLGTDYIDLYQLHAPDPATPIDETLGALDDLVHAGKVRYVGCSNFLAYKVARALGRSDARHLVRFDSVQPRYNLLFRQIERELLPLCAEEGLGVIPYNPIAGGLLSGKHSASSSPTEGTRFTLGNAAGNYQDRYWHDREFATVEELRKIAEREGVPLVTLSVAWVLAHPAVTAPIIGASRPDQLEASLAAAEFTMSRELKDGAGRDHPRLPPGRRRPLRRERSMGLIPASHHDLLEARVATFATVGIDGYPQLSEVWFLAEDDTIRLSLNSSRQKTKNIVATPGLHSLHPRPGQHGALPGTAGRRPRRARRRLPLRRQGRGQIRQRPARPRPAGPVPRGGHTPPAQGQRGEHGRLRARR